MLLASGVPLDLQRQRAIVDIAPRTAGAAHLPDLRPVRSKLKLIRLDTFHPMTLERVVNKNKAAAAASAIHPRPKGRGLSRKISVKRARHQTDVRAQSLCSGLRKGTRATYLRRPTLMVVAPQHVPRSRPSRSCRDTVGWKRPTYEGRPQPKRT